MFDNRRNGYIILSLLFAKKHQNNAPWNSFYLVLNLLLGPSPNQQLKDVQTAKPGGQMNGCHAILLENRTQKVSLGRLGKITQVAECSPQLRARQTLSFWSTLTRRCRSSCTASLFLPATA